MVVRVAVVKRNTVAISEPMEIAFAAVTEGLKVKFGNLGDDRGKMSEFGNVPTADHRQPNALTVLRVTIVVPACRHMLSFEALAARAARHQCLQSMPAWQVPHLWNR
jgi:hypothetical protein